MMSTYQKSTYWAGVIKEWESSNKIQSVFCKEKNISHYAFTYWRSRLNNKKKGEKEGTFVKVLPISRKKKVISQNESINISFKDNVKISINSSRQVALAVLLINSLEG